MADLEGFDDVLYEDIDITGVVNTTTADAGLISSQEEPKKVLGIIITVSAWEGNTVLVDHERESVAEIPDRIIDNYDTSGSANVQLSTTKRQFFRFVRDLPIGDTFKVKILCGGTATDVKGCYAYQITG